MTIISTMTLVEAGSDKVLCGFDDDQTSAFVLRKQTATDYALHQIGISEADQALRSILAADQSESGELVAAILQTVKTPTRKPRKRKAK